ncbi:DegT/DnrJ/EryC1/StrS family aminotransferase, partial [Planctomycetota bacterium]
MTELGYNYRLSDIHCALGRSQLRKLPRWIEQRRAVASHYDAAFAQLEGVQPLARRPDRLHAYHLYVIRLEPELAPPHNVVFERLRSAGICVNVHYAPVHRHHYYQSRFSCVPGTCSVAERMYERLLSLPMYPTLTGQQLDRVEGCAEERVVLGLTVGSAVESPLRNPPNCQTGRLYLRH